MATLYEERDIRLDSICNIIYYVCIGVVEIHLSLLLNNYYCRVEVEKYSTVVSEIMMNDFVKC